MDMPRVKLPGQARKGEIIEIKTLLPHPMENGLRRDQNGTTIPRKIINRFMCEFNNQPVFSCDLDTAVAAQPYLQFSRTGWERGTFPVPGADGYGRPVAGEVKLAT